MQRMASHPVTAEIEPYAILRIVSFWIHSVSLSIHLPIFLIKLFRQSHYKHGFVFGIFLDCNHAPHHRWALRPAALLLLRGGTQWSNEEYLMALRPGFH